jgi:SAM-dependent methyltransferase
MPSRHVYDNSFFDYINEGSTRSAKKIVPLLMQMTSPRSVLDIGCGAGAWLNVWGKAGLDEWIGVDGDYVDAEKLLIPESHFHRRDLSVAFDLDRMFDLVCTFEVAEHIVAERADEFVGNIVRHGDVIAFSAATPGQGGEFHVNEQPYDYWRSKFLARGYQCFDALRPSIVGDRLIEPWYRYNILLFANPTGSERLSAGARAARLDDEAPAPDVAPLAWKMRRAILRRAPRPLVEGLANLVHGLTLATLR